MCTDRLLNNPWAQPPLPTDWEVHPTHRRHNPLPYSLAQLWDEKKSRHHKRLHKHKPDNSSADPATRIPKEVRAKLKRARAAKGLLQDLEEDVRVFLQRWNDKRASRSSFQPSIQGDKTMDVDSEDDEIVFVGRNGSMQDLPSSSPSSPSSKKLSEPDIFQREKLVFETPADDRSAGFGRWLVHSIAQYYGLRTWSVTVPGDPARREAYVGITESMEMAVDMPRPLWGMV